MWHFLKLFFIQHYMWLSSYLVLLMVMNVLMIVDVGMLAVSIWYVNCIMGSIIIVTIVIMCIKDYIKYHHTMEIKETTGYEQQYIRMFHTLLNKQEIVLQEEKLQRKEIEDSLLAWVHEMKSPMTAMHIMIEGNHRLEKEWLRMHLLLDQQLHQTRLYTIEKDSLMKPTAIQPIISQEIKALRAWCLEKDIGFELEGEYPDQVTDAKWFAFIIRQILSNAVKYSHNGSQIYINMQGQLLTIKDEGIGISSIDLPRIFQKSYTGTTGRESKQATGMGLYLANKAAHQLGITLHVTSIVNEGTAFYITFPQENDYHLIKKQSHTST